MQTVEVPRQDWSETLDGFSQVHEGWLVTLEVLLPDLGAQPEIRELPLVGVTVEPHDADDVISIAAARADGDQITHTIHAARRLWIERTEDGADLALQIESADATRAILKFRTPARPETVDGIGPDRI